MSKKALEFIPKSKGGWMEDEPSKRIFVEPEPAEPVNEKPIVKPEKTKDQEYMTVAAYANYISRPTTVVYRMIKDGSINSVKIGNKLHIVLD